MQRRDRRPALTTWLVVAIAVTAILAAACSSTEQGTTTASPPPTLAPPGFVDDGGVPPPPALDRQRIASGEALYQQYCAECHKADLSGEPGWQIPNADGTYKPPPQDSTGHTWHHPDQLLLEIVRDGQVDPIATMPTFGSILSDAEILDVLEFIKSSWEEELRAVQWEITWQARQQDS